MAAPIGPDVGKQVRVGKYNAFRVTGAARRVLDERCCTRILQLRQRDRGRRCFNVSNAGNGIQAVHQIAEQASQLPPFRQGDEHAGARIAQDPGLTPQMIFELRKPHRRVDRHRYCSPA